MKTKKSASDYLNQKALTLMKRDNIGYVVALNLARQEDPELESEFFSGLASKRSSRPSDPLVGVA